MNVRWSIYEWNMSGRFVSNNQRGGKRERLVDADIVW